ncbi:hypothetical protein FA13DRAFT_1084802 [Coprinellus micaceus]|uniref:Uncharacterized protein n=1 Tax=Coprinellus micaceus TaxID=71717 RepID=A0A4Y7TRH1_COPMI|nr:hypothetical protein FA13DRAFT_1084802 [Coprinellus micaceus]
MKSSAYHYRSGVLTGALIEEKIFGTDRTTYSLASKPVSRRRILSPEDLARIRPRILSFIRDLMVSVSIAERWHHLHSSKPFRSLSAGLNTSIHPCSHLPAEGARQELEGPAGDLATELRSPTGHSVPAAPRKKRRQPEAIWDPALIWVW